MLAIAMLLMLVPLATGCLRVRSLDHHLAG